MPSDISFSSWWSPELQQTSTWIESVINLSVSTCFHKSTYNLIKSNNYHVIWTELSQNSLYRTHHIFIEIAHQRNQQLFHWSTILIRWSEQKYWGRHPSISFAASSQFLEFVSQHLSILWCNVAVDLSNVFKYAIYSTLVSDPSGLRLQSTPSTRGYNPAKNSAPIEQKSYQE